MVMMIGSTMKLFYLFIIISICCNRVQGKRYRCGLLKDPKNGKAHNYSRTLYAYTCNKGYQLIAESQYRKCTVGRKWEPAQEPTCKDVDECKYGESQYPCSDYADCINSIGSFECVCRPGYSGNGYDCHAVYNQYENYLHQDDLCGIVTKQYNNTGKRIRRIIGGQYSRPGEWPWMALITVNGGHSPMFGGVLIKPGWVLTVANLLHTDTGVVNEKNIIISLGENDLNRPEIEEQQFRVKQGGIYIHKKYTNTSLRNNIALLHLEDEAEMTDYVKPICLVDRDRAKSFERGRHLATVSGWGVSSPMKLRDLYTSIPRMYSGVLQDITLPIVGPYKCRKATPYKFYKKTMLCAGMIDNEAAPCTGDGGSPLTILDPKTNRWLLLGLYSWSEGCGQPSKYSYYTRVAKFRNWIDDITEFSNNLL